MFWDFLVSVLQCWWTENVLNIRAVDRDKMESEQVAVRTAEKLLKARNYFWIVRYWLGKNILKNK